MKKINKLVQLCIIILCISALNAFAQKDKDENELRVTCCHTIKKEVISSPENPCCILVNIFSNSCGGFKIVLVQKKR